MDRLHDFIHTLIAHFIPHEGNDYRPHVLQKTAVLGMLLLVTLTFTLANFQALLWQTSDWLVGAVLPAVVVDLTNTQRAELSLATLSRNTVLDAAAQLKADDMAKNSYFSHDSPTGITPWHWFDMAGYRYVYAGENLAVYFTDSKAVVDAWMKSPTHRANIVGAQYREIGVGTARGTYNGYDTVFVVQLFGTPAIAPAEITPVRPPTPRPEPLAVAEPEVLPLIPETTELATAPVVSEIVPQVAGEATEVPLAEVAIEPQTPVVTSANQEVMPTPVETAIPQPTPDMPVAPTPVTTIVTDDFVALQSGVASVKSNLEPAPFTPDDTVSKTTTPTIARLATQPNTILQTVYLFVGIITGLALLASVVIEWRKHRPLQTAYGIGLLLLMCGLFYIHTLLTAGALLA